MTPHTTRLARNEDLLGRALHTESGTFQVLGETITQRPLVAKNPEQMDLSWVRRPLVSPGWGHAVSGPGRESNWTAGRYAADGQVRAGALKRRASQVVPGRLFVCQACPGSGAKQDGPTLSVRRREGCSAPLAGRRGRKPIWIDGMSVADLAPWIEAQRESSPTFSLSA